MGVTVRTKRLPNGLIISGRYKVIDFVGAGGFAAVYEAHDIQQDQPVALKVLNLFAPAGDAVNTQQQEASKKRFVREAQVMEGIQHSSVVNVHDFGFVDEPYQPYIVMDLLRGHTLDVELHHGGSLSASRVLPMFRRCLEALGEGHRKGIVHRDLKPSNLFLCSPGTPQEDMKILDYGIATISQSKDDRLTSSGQIVGTYRYLPPEYIKGRTATPALDVYQMGLLLVEMLMGAPVVEGGNQFATLMFHVEGRLGLPEPLAHSPLGPILHRALATDHLARYPDGYAFEEALAGIDPDAIPACSPETPRISVKELGALAGAARAATPARVTTPAAAAAPARARRSNTSVGDAPAIGGFTPEAARAAMEARIQGKVSGRLGGVSPMTPASGTPMTDPGARMRTFDFSVMSSALDPNSDESRARAEELARERAQAQAAREASRQHIRDAAREADITVEAPLRFTPPPEPTPQAALVPEVTPAPVPQTPAPAQTPAPPQAEGKGMGYKLAVAALVVIGLLALIGAALKALG